MVSRHLKKKEKERKFICDIANMLQMIFFFLDALSDGRKVLCPFFPNGVKTKMKEQQQLAGVDQLTLTHVRKLVLQSLAQ